MPRRAPRGKAGGPRGGDRQGGRARAGGRRPAPGGAARPARAAPARDRGERRVSVRPVVRHGPARAGKGSPGAPPQALSPSARAAATPAQAETAVTAAPQAMSVATIAGCQRAITAQEVSS